MKQTLTLPKEFLKYMYWGKKVIFEGGMASTGIILDLTLKGTFFGLGWTKQPRWVLLKQKDHLHIYQIFILTFHLEYDVGQCLLFFFFSNCDPQYFVNIQVLHYRLNKQKTRTHKLIQKKWKWTIKMQL